jgi:hypothetical protein
LQAYVKKIDGSAVTSSDLTLYYNASLITTYTAMGNGWYRLTAAVTGIAAATITGVALVATNTPMFVAGVQLAEQADISPMTTGDMLGCRWSGTAHASTSVRAVGYIRIPTAGILSAGGGSICVAVKHLSGYDRGANAHMFNDGTLAGYYVAASDDWRFTDGTNTVDTVAQTFVSGDIDILHFVWGPGRLEIYRNGASAVAGTTFTPWTLGDYLYIGTSATPSSHFNGTFLDFTIWDKPLTTAEIAADYDDISDHVRGGDGYGQRLSTILWGWTKDGDNVVDNYYDATHSHYMIIGGVPGTYDAETEIIGIPGTAFSGLNLSNFPTRRYFNPSFLFEDLGGTVVADSVGGSAYVTSISIGSGDFCGGAAPHWTKSAYPELSETEFYLLGRIKDASAAYIRIQPYVTSSGYVVNISSDFSRIYATSTTYKLFRTNLGVTQKNYSGYDSNTQLATIYGYRNSGTANITTDYVALFPRPYLYCFGYKMTKFTLSEKTLVKTTGAPFSGMVDVIAAVGDPIEFSPNYYNIFQTLMGCETENPELAYTLTYQIYCTPRYLIL